MSEAPSTTASYRCPRCGAPQALVPGADALGCGHCGHRVPITPAPRAIHEHDFEEARRRVRRGPATAMVAGGHEVACGNCGAHAVTDRQATRCAFCDEPLVVAVEPTPDTIAPEAVLPFAIDKAAADAALRRWMRSRWFAPGDLVRRHRRDGLDGVYVPYWTFDSHTTTRYTGARGDHYDVEEETTDASGNRQTRRVQHTRWSPASGTVWCDFDDVLIAASRGMPRQRLEQLEPWPLGELRPFDGAFLAGFVAERYSIDLDEGFREAGAIMERQIERRVRDDIGGDEQRVHSMDVRHADVRFKHVLLPVWVSSFRYRERVYRLVVNAHTGEVAGDRPWSAVKIALFVLALAALVIAIVLVVLHLREPTDPEPDPGRPGYIQS